MPLLIPQWAASVRRENDGAGLSSFRQGNCHFGWVYTEKWLMPGWKWGVCRKWIFIRQKCALPGFYPFMHLSIHIKCLMCWIYLRRFLIKEFLLNKSIFNHFPGFTWWRKLRHQGFNKILRLTAFLKKNLRKSTSVCRRNLCPEQPIKIKELPSLYF